MMSDCMVTFEPGLAQVRTTDVSFLCTKPPRWILTKGGH
jgi:hypothetical protein